MRTCVWRRRHRVGAVLASVLGIAALTAGLLATTPAAGSRTRHFPPQPPTTTNTTSPAGITTTTTPGTTTTTTPGSTTTPTTTPGSHTTTTTPTTTSGSNTTTTNATPNNAPPSTSNCQNTEPLGLSANWTCSFDDEFNGTSLNTSVWTPQLTANSGYVAGADCYVNNPDTVSESGGYLNLSIVKVAPFTCTSPTGSFTSDYEAGMVSTWDTFDQTYGAFEVNAKLPAATVAGLQETFWLYPQTLTYGPWPDSGEIDFAEFYSEYPGYDVPYIHYADAGSDPDVTAYTCTIDQDAFNTYELDWQPGVLTVLYNGNVCLVDHPLTGQEPFNDPFFIALTQALGQTTNAPTAGTPTSGTTQVDWVRAWKSS